MKFLPDLQAYADNLHAITHRSETDSITLTHLTFLLTFLRTEYAALLSELTTHLEHGEITYDHLWAVYVPRKLLFALCPVTGEPRAVRLVTSVIHHNGQSLAVEYVEHNARAGPQFGFAALDGIWIPEFTGVAKIADLPAYPFKFLPDAEGVRERLIARGRKWESLQGRRFMSHDSATAFQTDNGRTLKFNV